jgi:hypothetical protein
VGSYWAQDGIITFGTGWGVFSVTWLKTSVLPTLVWQVYLAVPYGGRQDAGLKPKYIQDRRPPDLDMA